MTLKSTSSPLDQYVKTEWREQLCTLAGIAYSGQSSEMQTIIDNIINEAFESLSQRAGHHPWGQQETTLSVVTGTDQTFSMPAAFRHLISIYEVDSSGTRILAAQSTKATFYDTQEGAAHPWTKQLTPVWFYDGLTSDEPPVQQWRRVGADNAGATAYVLFRPYYNLLGTSGQDTYPYLPPAEGKALREQMLEDWHAAMKNPDLSMFHRARKEDAIRSLEVNDRTTVEAPMRLGVDPDFARQMG